MERDYTSNLCTFMGREENVKILIQYIEKALEIDAVDRYYMIDMTRCIEDHEYIYQQQQKLDAKYPGRVFVVNRELRGKQLRDGTWEETLGFWEPFYKFCKTFTDKDIIIKCDDDTLYFDVERLRAASDLRWENKAPLLMHANTINNGVCAYHQAKKGIWNKLDKQIKEYPTSGLTGPLFSHPDIACDCHSQFTDDLIKDATNVRKYWLKENIYFSARVSINYIFMLGTDREELSKIDAQDEYVASSKLGQQLDRPNMIIGDFVAAHHTYGVQEPVMEKLGTFKMYENLVKSMQNEWETTCVYPKDITDTFNPASTIKSSGKYLMKYWSNDNSYTIKNNTTGKYISLKWEKTERVKVIDKNTKKGLGVFWHKTELHDTDDINDSTLFTVNVNKPTLIQIQECTEVLKASDPGTDNPRFLSFPIKLWFQQNYKKQLTRLVKHKGAYKIESITNPGYFLVSDGSPPNKILYFFKEGGEDTWDLKPYKQYKNDVIMADIDRGNQSEVENDPTIATTTGLPINKNFREFYWMVSEYIWEFIDIGNSKYHIKLIADDKPPLYLSVKNKSSLFTGNKPQAFTLNKNKLKHVPTGLEISCKGGKIGMENTGTNLNINI